MKDLTILGAVSALLSLSYASPQLHRRQTSASTSAVASDTASSTSSSAAASSSVIVPGDTFHHRVSGQTIVVGDYLYIDGGELTTWSQQ